MQNNGQIMQNSLRLNRTINKIKIFLNIFILLKVIKNGYSIKLNYKNNITKAIVFANRKDEVSKLCDFLQKNNIKALKCQAMSIKKTYASIRKFKSNTAYFSCY